jgi:hypothetical protein
MGFFDDIGLGFVEDIGSAAVDLSVGVATLGQVSGGAVEDLGQEIFDQVTGRAEREAIREQAEVTKEFAGLQREQTVKALFLQFSQLQERGALEQGQDTLFTRLRKAQIGRQATIARSQARVSQQKKRIGGIGGSFATTERGVSELTAQEELSTTQADVEFGARSEQRSVERRQGVERFNLAREEAFFTERATIAGVTSQAQTAILQSRAAFTGDIIGLGFNILGSKK